MKKTNSSSVPKVNAVACRNQPSPPMKLPGTRQRAAVRDGGVDQLVAQVVGVVSIATWTLITAGVLFMVLCRTVGLRVNETFGVLRGR